MPGLFNYPLTHPHTPNSAPATPIQGQDDAFPEASYQSPLPTVQEGSPIIPQAPIAAHGNHNSPIMIPPPFFIFRCSNSPIKQSELHDSALDHDEVIDAFLSDIKGFTEDQIRDFQCPITQAIFKDPVIASDGNTYELDALSDYADMLDNYRGVKSPITKQPLSTTLTHNNVIQKILNSYIHEINETEWRPTQKENTPPNNRRVSKCNVSCDQCAPLKRARR